MKVQQTWTFTLSFLFAAGYALVALSIKNRKIAYFDEMVTNAVRAFEAPMATYIMKGFTIIGSTWVIAALVPLIALYLYYVLGHRRELILFIVVIIGSSLLNVLLKAIFHRARPTLHRIVEAAGYSFPSGHAMAAFTLYGVVTFLLWRHTSTAFRRMLLIAFSACMILAIGISRIYLGVHYPSDVLGGYLAGGSWLALSIWFFRRHAQAKTAV